MRSFHRPAPAGRRPRTIGTIAALSLAVVLSGIIWHFAAGTSREVAQRGHSEEPGNSPGATEPNPSVAAEPAPPALPPSLSYEPKQTTDTSGFFQVWPFLDRWSNDASLTDIAATYKDAGYRAIEEIDRGLSGPSVSREQWLGAHVVKAVMFNYEGEPAKAAEILRMIRVELVKDPVLAARFLYSVIHLQGVVSLRIGETDNCVMCRGESSCILPLSPSAVHKIPDGSRAAIGYFHEYLAQFPESLEVRWLLNLAHMTLGEYPEKVDPRYVLSLENYSNTEHAIGKFRDVGHLAGVNRLNESGGAILEDFDGDRLLDLVVTSISPTAEMKFYRNQGDGSFVDRTEEAGLTGQLGGLNCVQTDFNNDGRMDLFIIRGAWFPSPIRPSLLENVGNGVFRDVTDSAGLSHPMNSNSACWGDYDNDGWLDLYVCGERQPNRLYHNEGNGRFVEMSEKAGIAQDGKRFCKGACWVDIDNDDFPDLLTNNLERTARLYRNNRNGTFSDVTADMDISGPREGFPCWAWDYDNDGWLDLFATSYYRDVDSVVRGLLGEPHGMKTINRLYRNRQGTGFEDVTREAGLDVVLATMGCNYADFDGDGFLDMYLGTGAPGLEFLVPNRMFRNLGGKRFADITASSGTGHLQKGHGVACGDWDRDGRVDLFVQLGGPAIGDRFHNALFQNPGHDNAWLTVRLIGEKTNRAAIGARIKVVTAAAEPLTIHRHVSSGSSFGANPLEQTIGLGKAERIAELEIHWPTSGLTQTFRDLAVNEMLEITEFAEEPRSIPTTPIPKLTWQAATTSPAD